MDDENSLANIVSVYGNGVSAPLLKTKDARLIQIRGTDGKLIAMFFRLSGPTWGFVTDADPDWEDHRRRLEIDDSKV